MLTNIDAVIFDLDGTLIDSMWMWRTIDIEYLARFGIELPENLQSEIEGMSFSETAVYFKERFGIEDSLEDIKQAWNDMAHDIYRDRVILKPGIGEFLPYLRSQGIKTGIATSNSKELVLTAVDGLNISNYFDAIHTSCEVNAGKPAPDIYLLVAQKLGVAPDRCLVFEDIVSGILAGKNAGMRVCAVEDDFSKPQEVQKRELADYYISDYREIIKNMQGNK